MRTPSSLVLSAALVVAASAAACGGGATGAPPPQDPSTVAGAGTAAAAPSSTATAPGDAVDPNTPGTTGPSSGSTTTPMKAIAASTLTAELPSLGLDAKKLPPLGKLEPKKLREVMKLFSKSLGAKCTDCHVEGDFAAPTRRKRIAEKMWNEYVLKLTMDDGSPVFCDTCHQGQLEFLERSDKKAIGHWMDENLVDRMKRVDGREHACTNESCHGANMEYTFLQKWAAK